MGGVIGAVGLAILIAAIVILTSSKDSDTSNQEAISLEDFLKGRLSSRSFNATWASGQFIYYYYLLNYQWRL